jgi:ribose 5-phosphate isomerase A
MIKGRGGAMYQEKILMRSAPKTYILIDQSKLVSRLGENFPVPVEISPIALHLVERELLRLGAVEAVLRPAKGKDGPIISENGNFILDVRFREIRPSLETEIKAITGVIESGLFIGYAVELIVAGS